MHIDTIIRTGVTRGLRPVVMPLPPQPTGWVASLRKRPVTFAEIHAVKLLEIVQPLLVKMRKRPGRTSLLAALDLLGQGRVDPDDVAEIIASWPDTPHLSRVRSGAVDDVRLWEDVKDVADMHSRGGHGPERSVERLARALGVLEALLSVPEGQRAAVLAGEMDEEEDDLEKIERLREEVAVGLADHAAGRYSSRTVAEIAEEVLSERKP